MNVFVFAARKGGVGKTTLTSTFAVLAHLEAARDAAPGSTPPRIATIDCDSQGCCSQFFNSRSGKRPGPDLFEASLGTLPVILEELRELGYAATFVDCGPAHGAVVAAAMRAATVIVVPTKASELDLEAARKTVAMAEAAGTPYFLQLCDVTFRTRAVGSAKEKLEEMGLPLLPVVHRRVDIPLASGETVFDRAPDSTAAKEMRKAYRALTGGLAPCVTRV